MPRVVQRTAELRRVAALPRRLWEPAATPEVVDAVTQHLKTSAGTMVLRPVQAAALVELHDHGGLFLQAGVGKGKTLISALAPTVLRAERPLLLVPAKLRDKTIKEFRTLREHWRMPAIRVESYEMLGRVQAKDMLDRFCPDLVILDEAHRVKNPKAACTRRLRRYVRERRAAGCPLRLLVMSGTIAKRSLRDFAHLLEWSLPETCPLPTDETDLIMWADAIDEKPSNPADPVDVGALLQFATVEEVGHDPLTQARRGVQRRIFETPGAMATKENDVDCSLVVECVEVAIDAATEEAFRHMKTTWSTPDGWPISDGVTMWRHARELALGFYYRWDPRPPQEWVTARSEWCALVRDILAHNRHGLDSELQVAQEVAEALRHGKHHVGAAKYRAWKDIEKTFVPVTMPVWISDRALDFCASWEGPGIVWVEHKAFGRRLSEATGLPYYTNGGKDARGRAIPEWPDPACGQGKVIASIASNGEGRNLQGWHEALVTSTPPTGNAWEQLLGREHRPGQPADEVTYQVMISCREQLSGFEQSMRDAQFHGDLLGSHMKLKTKNNYINLLDDNEPRRHADIIIPTFSGRGWAWREPVRSARDQERKAS